MSGLRPTNVPLALAAISLSLLLWLGIYPQSLPEQQTQQISAKLSYQGLGPELVVTEAPKQITLLARGPTSRLREIDPEQLEAVASFDVNAKPGRIRTMVTIVPPRYKDLFPYTEYATFTIERVVTRKLPVEVETLGQIQDPLLALDIALPEPQTVTASGPESIIKDLTRARVRFDLSEITVARKDAQNVGVEPVASDNTVPDNVDVDPKVVRVTPVISSSRQQKSVSVTAQLSGGPPVGYIMASYEVTPQLLTIRGTSRAIAGVTQLTTEPINLNGLTENKEFLTNVQVPEGIAVAGARRVRVKVMINKVPAPTPPDTP